MWDMAYDPSRFVVSATGVFKPDELVASLEEHLSSLNHRTGNISVPLYSRRRSINLQTMYPGLAQFAVCSPLPIPTPATLVEISLLDAFLGTGFTSPLFDNLREKEGLTYSPETEIEYGANYGFYLAHVATYRPGSLGRISSLMHQTFKDASSITRKQFETAREKLIGIYRQTGLSIPDLREILQNRELAGLGAETAYTKIDEVKKVTYERIRALAEQITRGKSTITILPTAA